LSQSTITAPPPGGFLYAWIDSGVPGARTVTRPGGAEITAAENHLHFVDWQKLIHNAVFADHGSTFTFDTATGLASFVANVAGDYKFDRCGDLCGLAHQTNVARTFAEDERLDSFYVPRGAIWLMGAEYEEIELAREVQFDQFRWRRGYGYSWGGARIYRWRLTMHKDALDSFDAGWCATGKVTLQMANATAIADSGTGYTGSLTGYVVGVQSQRWLGPARDVAEVELLIVGAD